MTEEEKLKFIRRLERFLRLSSDENWVEFVVRDESQER